MIRYENLSWELKDAIDRLCFYESACQQCTTAVEKIAPEQSVAILALMREYGEWYSDAEEARKTLVLHGLGEYDIKECESYYLDHVKGKQTGGKVAR